MILEDNRKREDLLPRKDIPDSWASAGSCPVCAAAPMRVVHLQGCPDYLCCSRCELSFEVEASTGTTIRLKNIPDQLGFAEFDLRHRWVKPIILKQLIENRSTILQQKNSAPGLPALSDDEVWQRMLSLYRLGNKPKMIEFTLMQSGATFEQAEAGFIRLKDWSEQDANIQIKKLFSVAAFTIVLVIALGVAGWFYTNSSIAATLNRSKGDPAAQGPVLPLEILKLIPDAVKPGFLKSPAAVVEKIGPKAARCPNHAGDAAQLFGGAASDWQRGSQPDSWQMITTGTPSTIHIPAGMYAGFIDNSSFVFTSANGPSTIHNINFVAIMCN